MSLFNLDDKSKPVGKTKWSKFDGLQDFIKPINDHYLTFKPFDTTYVIKDEMAKDLLRKTKFEQSFQNERILNRIIELDTIDTIVIGDKVCVMHTAEWSTIAFRENSTNHTCNYLTGYLYHDHFIPTINMSWKDFTDTRLLESIAMNIYTNCTQHIPDGNHKIHPQKAAIQQNYQDNEKEIGNPILTILLAIGDAIVNPVEQFSSVTRNELMRVLREVDIYLPYKDITDERRSAELPESDNGAATTGYIREHVRAIAEPAFN